MCERYNCGTCKGELKKPYAFGKFCAFGVDGEVRHDTHPSDLHPCSRGEAIVASAVAEVEFDVDGSFVFAYHHGQCIGSLYKRNWDMDCAGNFCYECGLRLPTASELPQMYERWKEGQG